MAHYRFDDLDSATQERLKSRSRRRGLRARALALGMDSLSAAGLLTGGYHLAAHPLAATLAVVGIVMFLPLPGPMTALACGAVRFEHRIVAGSTTPVPSMRPSRRAQLVLSSLGGALCVAFGAAIRAITISTCAPTSLPRVGFAASRPHRPSLDSEGIQRSCRRRRGWLTHR